MDDALDASLADVARSGRGDLAGVAREVGARAARGGAPLSEVLDDLELAFDGRVPAYEAIREAALAWADATSWQQLGRSCEDPLTSLTTVTHLRTRLDELYRGAEHDGTSLDQTHALVVVELSPLVQGNSLEASIDALDVAEQMRTAFGADETLTQTARRRFVALVRADRADPTTVGLLGHLVRRALPSSSGPRLRVVRPPASADDLGRFLTGLCA